MIRDRAGRGAAKLAHEAERFLGGFGFGPFEINDYDDPVTIRARKYATGTHILLKEIRVETGATPREVVWSRGKARLYRYRASGGDYRRGYRGSALRTHTPGLRFRAQALRF